MFGIKNARRTGRCSREDEFLLIGGIYQTIADGSPSRLLQQNISCRINRLHLPGCFSCLTFRSWLLLALGAQCDDSSASSQSRICTFKNDRAVENRLPLGVVVMKVVRQDIYRNLLPALVCLYKNCGNPRIPLLLSVQSSFLTIEIDQRRLNDVPALPQASASTKAGTRRALRYHLLGGDVDWHRRCKHRSRSRLFLLGVPPRLLLRVGGLYIAVGPGFSG